MATILLSAVGASLGASLGGAVLGVPSLVIGRAVGATVGRILDQRLLGSGSEPVEVGKVDRFKVTGASPGARIADVYGRMRVPGHVIWASQFLESKQTTGGGKGAPSKPKTTQYSYSVSLAIGLCEGVIQRVGRIWADGMEVSPEDFEIRVYQGTSSQLPDPKIEVIEGISAAPAFRGTAYVVIENLALAPFGNRVPQFTFEVLRYAQPETVDTSISIAEGTRAVALMPGTGEYALATTPTYSRDIAGTTRAINVNAAGEGTDFSVSLKSLTEEAPNCQSVLLISSWFGDDLRCGSCQIKPKVEHSEGDAAAMPWRVSGVSRAAADTLGRYDDRPVYGGTPADMSLIEAVEALKAAGQDVVFYPFILMEILDGNSLHDPWTGAEGQAPLPWRGRITLEDAPGQVGSTDKTAGATAEVRAFFGTAAATDFAVSGKSVVYSGPDEWSYRRFILHYAALCKAAGGVEAFCIGSEMRSLTQIRGSANAFPAVYELRALAIEVRAILGAGTKIGYAADWSEYFGYTPQDGSGDHFFHLDPLWSDPVIDFIGIDNYMPLSDWRSGRDHADADWGAIYDLAYLKANIAGGEGYDWYYPSDAARDGQHREAIADAGYGKPWIYRYKDLKNWWSEPHFNRIGGVEEATATAWIPESKPFWFTELGCAAIDKGTNQPNKFLDEKSSESAVPHYSNGARDDLIQAQYLAAMYDYWADPEKNPVSASYGGAMVDMSRAHVWAWDARPYPAFPNALDLWSDGENYQQGHWITGRISGQPLAVVVAEICERAGLKDFDVSGLFGIVKGYGQSELATGRSTLQPLMLAYGLDAIEADGVIRFVHRRSANHRDIDPQTLVVEEEEKAALTHVRLPNPETTGAVRLTYIAADGAFEVETAETIFSDDPSLAVTQSDLAMVTSQADAEHISERWLAESRVARDTVRFALPPSAADVRVADVVSLTSAEGMTSQYRVDRIDDLGLRRVDAVRMEPEIYETAPKRDEIRVTAAFAAPTPVLPLFMDLPLLSGDEIPHAPHIAVHATPWPGAAAVYASPDTAGFELNTLVETQSSIGLTETALLPGMAGRWDRQAALRVRLYHGALSSADALGVLNGANVLAIGNGSDGDWEILQFQKAVLIGEGLYDLSGFLRGQQGTDPLAEQGWPAGSYVVVLDGQKAQIQLPSAARGLARHYRIGPAARPLEDGSYVQETLAFSGVGLRPYRPAHLRGLRNELGQLALSWVRRTRLDGDGWQGLDVPLGETSEQYLLRVLNGETVLREVSLTTPEWTYLQSMQMSDGIGPTATIAVAQVSDRFGPGPFTKGTFYV